MLNEGKVVEQEAGRQHHRRYPKDSYTQLLLDAIPNPFEEAPR